MGPDCWRRRRLGCVMTTSSARFGRIRCLYGGSTFVVPTVAASVDLVVHLGIDEHGVRRVNEIVAVPGRVENDVIETEPIFVRDGTELRRTGGMPPRPELFQRRGIDIHRILGGDSQVS